MSRPTGAKNGSHLRVVGEGEDGHQLVGSTQHMPSSFARRVLRRFPKLAPSQTHLRIISVNAIIFLGLFIATGLIERMLLVDEAAPQIERTADLIASRTSAIFRRYDATFHDMERRIYDGADKVDEVSLLTIVRAVKEQHPGLAAVFVAGADGRILAHTSRTPPYETGIADRSFYQTLHDGRDRWAVGEPGIGRLSGEPRIVVAYRLEKPGQVFDGVIGLSIKVDEFGDLSDVSRDMASDSVVIVRGDGTVLTERINGRASEAGLRQQAETDLNPRANALQFLTTSDDHERVFTFRKLAPFQLYLGYGKLYSGLVSTWYRRMVIEGVIFALACAISTLVLIGLAQRR